MTSIPQTSQPKARPLNADDHLILIDGSSYIFRAYHALPPLTRKSDGLPVGAVQGFCNMMWRLMRDKIDGEPASHLAVVFDHSAETFRNALYDQYKAHRPDPPEDLKPQFGLIRHATRAFDVPCIEQEGFEADDIIATYACQAARAGAKVTIVASDKDLMQLVRPGVTMYDTMKEKRIAEPEVLEKFGVTPDKVVDVQALCGDSIDNVPGVPGIGVKTAAQLIGEYGDLEGVLKAAADGLIKQPKRREALVEHAEKARISKTLVLLEQNVPLEIALEDLLLDDPDPKRLVAFLKAMEFTAVTRRVAAAYALDINEIDPDPALAAPGAGVDGFEPSSSGTVSPPRTADVQEMRAPLDPAALSPLALAEARKAEGAATAIDRSRYETLMDLAALEAFVAAGIAAGVVGFDTETNSLDAMQADLVGVSLALPGGRACYVPLLHKGGSDLFASGVVPGQIPSADAISALRSLLEHSGVLKVGQNIKYDRIVMLRHGVSVAPYDDTLLISYVLDAGRGGFAGHGMDTLSERHLNHQTIRYGEVAGTGRAAVTFDMVPLDKATPYAAEDADVTLRLWQALKPRLAAERKTAVYETLERPLVDVLGRMEMRGIMVDRQILSRLSGDFAQTLARLEDEIYTLAGQRFTIGSPKQLADILFGQMQLSGARKTATGQWSTNARFLEDLAAEGHELPRRILDWRQLAKLKSTYTDALPAYVNRETGRVHTSYALASTTTGRLSSSEPNLQNIPIRTEEGRRIRTAFIAEKGKVLISADYSQIELRILAHVANIPQLRKAFAEGQDIHAITASEMFGVPVEGMPSDIRRRAKAINFGIVYGISAFGLAAQLSIPREEAGAYIKRYFERFPGIRDYMDATKRFCREHLYVETLFGRVCHYPQIASSNPSERAAVERQAINAPIQGTAADIIRRAMIRMEPALEQAGLSDVKMLLQVHDELVFEAPAELAEAAIPVIRRVMVDAPHPAVDLTVPLVVDARAASNWDEAH